MHAPNFLALSLIVLVLSGCGLWRQYDNWSKKMGGYLPTWGERCENGYLCFSDDEKQQQNTASPTYVPPPLERGAVSDQTVFQPPVGVPQRFDAPYAPPGYTNPAVPPLPPGNYPSYPPANPSSSHTAPPQPYEYDPYYQGGLTPQQWQQGGQAQPQRPLESWENPAWKKDLPASPIDDIAPMLEW